MKKYQVIGGQYEPYWYGESDNLTAAKRIATAHEEYWDNWQGWHKPCIYAAEDCTIVKSHGMITHVDGSMICVPSHANPVAYWEDGKWWDGRELV